MIIDYNPDHIRIRKEHPFRKRNDIELDLRLHPPYPRLEIGSKVITFPAIEIWKVGKRSNKTQVCIDRYCFGLFGFKKTYGLVDRRV